MMQVIAFMVAGKKGKLINKIERCSYELSCSPSLFPIA